MYEITVRFADRESVSTCETFQELSDAIDRAWAAPGFTGYTVRGI